MGSARSKLAALYRRFVPPPAPASQEPPSPFLRTLEETGDIEAASVAVARTLRTRGRVIRLRTIAMALQRNPSTRTAGDVSRAFVAIEDRQLDFAWALLNRHEPKRILELAPTELFRSGFAAAPSDATKLLEQLRSGEISCQLGPKAWRAIANGAFAVGEEELSGWALDRSVAASKNKEEARAGAAKLREWYGRRARRTELDAKRPIAFALIDGSSPDVGRGEHVADDRQRRAVLGALSRFRGPTYEGDAGLVRRVTGLSAKVPSDNVREVAATAVHLYRAGRDATSYADVAQGTWLVWVGRLPHPLFGIAADLPFDSRYRPVFASLRIETVRSLTDAMLDQLRRAAPVGCADRDTYYLMRAADVPAFLSDDAPNAVADLVGQILAGNDADSVYAAWRTACEPAVAAGIARDAEFAELPPIGVDVDAACRTVRQASVVIERAEPGPEGAEINLEFSLDGNLKHQTVVVLDSIVRRSSRPIRLFVMCRDHGPADFERMAKRFPTVSFVWMPTDNVSYGDLGGSIKHITISTMDRLLLPELLDDRERVIHHDLDAVCLTDIAELADIDLGGNPIAAVTTSRPNFQSGFHEVRRAANRLRDQGEPSAARELIARAHLRHKFDYKVFNAGVMVLDLARMRADGFCREFFPYAERFGMNDQAVLNIYAGASRFELDPEWNWCPRLDDYAHPRIAHWSGPIKPWGQIWVNGHELWDAAEAAAMTPDGTRSATAPGK